MQTRLLTTCALQYRFRNVVDLGRSRFNLSAQRQVIEAALIFSQSHDSEPSKTALSGTTPLWYGFEMMVLLLLLVIYIYVKVLIKQMTHQLQNTSSYRTPAIN